LAIPNEVLLAKLLQKIFGVDARGSHVSLCLRKPSKFSPVGETKLFQASQNTLKIFTFAKGLNPQEESWIKVLTLE